MHTLLNFAKFYKLLTLLGAFPIIAGSLCRSASPLSTLTQDCRRRQEPLDALCQNNVLYPVILAGGAGTRLWPLSRHRLPKQFLSLLGGGTMLQDTLVRLEGVSTASPLIVCNESHGEIALRQFTDAGRPALAAILEPEGRNTAPAVTLAALHLRKIASPGEEPFMLTMPADNVIRSTEEFQRSLKAGLPMARAGYMVTFGVVPLQPHTGYGYIRRGRFLRQYPGLPAAMEVASFVEKPNVANARQYLRDGRYLWNSGIFLMSASVWLEALERCRPDIAQVCLEAYNAAEKDGPFLRPHRDGFLSCPAESIDYAVMEKTAEDAEVRVATVPLSGGWSDLGSWAQIWEEREGDEDGNVVEGSVYLESVQNSLVLSTERTVAAVGLKDAVVVETPDAVLVASRDQVQNVRRVAERLNNKTDDNPPDGRLKVDEGDGFVLYRVSIEPQKGLDHLASPKGETWTQASGKIKLMTDLDERTLEAGDSVRLAPNHAYRMENCGPDSSEALLMVLDDPKSAGLEEGPAS